MLLLTLICSRFWTGIVASSGSDASVPCEVNFLEGCDSAIDPVLLQHSISLYGQEERRTGRERERERERRGQTDPVIVPQPDGTTYTSIHPEGAQAFVERFMGVSPKPVAWRDHEQFTCADIFFNAFCLDKRESILPGFAIHFVNGHEYPSGPMSTHDFYTYAENVLSPMDKWNDFMQPASGFLVRNLTVMWQAFADAGQNVWLTKSGQHGPYTIWAVLPGGIVYTYTSFVLDPKLTALAVHFRQPCDPPPEAVYSMHSEESDSWKNHSWPVEHAFLPFYFNIPVHDPEAEAQQFLDIVDVQGLAGSWTTRQQEGCVAVKKPGSQTEYRFEKVSQMNRTRTESFPYLFSDFVAYLGRIHDSLKWQEYNAWADFHHVVLVGYTSQPYQNYLDFEKRLQQMGLTYLKKARNEFESFIVLTRDQTAVFQFKFMNLDRYKYLSTNLDVRIPGCDEDSELYDWYGNLAKSGIKAPDMTKVLWKAGYLETEILGYNPPHFTNQERLGEPFDFCAGPSESFNITFETSFDCLSLSNLKLCAPKQLLQNKF